LPIYYYSIYTENIFDKISKKIDSSILIQDVAKIIIIESFISLQISICQYFWKISKIKICFFLQLVFL